MSNIKNKLRNLDNNFVDKSIPYITISNVNNQLVKPFDKYGVAKKCEEKGKQTQCKWTGLSAEDIIKMWDDKAAVSREYGKKVDEYTDCILNENKSALELYMLDNDVDNDVRLKSHISAFDEFYNRLMQSGDVEFVDREIEVWNKVKTENEEFYVKGRLDALFYNKRTDIWIVIDWKSNESITTKTTRWTEHMLGVAKDLYAIDWNTYTLQVYNYKEALLQNYLPEGTDASRVQCMIVNLPENPYENSDAVLGKDQKYKAYMGAFPYNETKINSIYEYAYKKDKLNKKTNKEDVSKTEEAKEQENFDLF